MSNKFDPAWLVALFIIAMTFTVFVVETAKIQELRKRGIVATEKTGIDTGWNYEKK
jgi:hypothetical protein